MTEDAPRFLVDGMLGRLAKWLRLLGYDAAYENAADDLELARRARAEGRILLTRDRELARRRGLHVFLIQSDEVQGQVEEVLRLVAARFGATERGQLRARCSICNLPLERLRPSAVVDRVPPYVLRTQSVFWHCRRCGRIYWNGTHAAAMRLRLRRVGAVRGSGDQWQEEE